MSIAELHEEGTELGIFSSAGFELVQRIAKAFASSTMVPERYQGDTNIGNCIIAINMAQRLDADPLMTMQNLYVVYGTPSWSAQFLIACFNKCGRFGPIRYKFSGEQGTDEWGCRAYATDKELGEVIEGSEITIAIAKAEGWHGKNGSKWQTMPEQMLRYRAASWLIRANAPDIAMGLHTVDEIRDRGPVIVEVATNGNQSELTNRIRGLNRPSHVGKLLEGSELPEEALTDCAEPAPEASDWEHSADFETALADADTVAKIIAICEHFSDTTHCKTPEQRDYVLDRCDAAKESLPKGDKLFETQEGIGQ